MTEEQMPHGLERADPDALRRPEDDDYIRATGFDLSVGVAELLDGGTEVGDIGIRFEVHDPTIHCDGKHHPGYTLLADDARALIYGLTRLVEEIESSG